jgi:hypothetical protein
VGGEEMKKMLVWFNIVCCILILVGFVFSTLGFGFFPKNILPTNLILPWESAIYGAVLIGWGLTLFLIGRLAFQRKDIALVKIMLLGIAVWLIIEAIYSAFIGVYFNIGVDLAVLLLLGTPLMISIQKLSGKSK